MQRTHEKMRIDTHLIPQRGVTMLCMILLIYGMRHAKSHLWEGRIV